MHIRAFLDRRCAAPWAPGTQGLGLLRAPWGYPARSTRGLAFVTFFCRKHALIKVFRKGLQDSPTCYGKEEEGEGEGEEEAVVDVCVDRGA